MKHPLNRFGRRNRNIVTGILVGIASIVLIAVYLDIPFGEVGKVLMAVVLFVLLIMLAAIAFIAIVKSIPKLFSGKNKQRPDDEESGDRQ